MLKLNCSFYKSFVVSSSGRARPSPETIHQNWFAKGLGLLLFVGVMLGFIESAYSFQQDANASVVVVIHERKDGTEEALVGLVVAELAEKTIVEVNAGWFSNGTVRGRYDKSKWSVMVNPGTSGAQIVPAKFLGTERTGVAKRVGGPQPGAGLKRGVDCILLSTASDQMPSPCVNVDFYSDAAELEPNNQVSLFSLKAEKDGGEWVVTPTEKTATVTTANVGIRKVNRLKSDDFVDGFVFESGQIFGFAKDISRKSPRSRKPEPVIRVTPLRLISDFGVPNLRSQYLVQKSTEKENATISIVLNWDDPLDAIKQLSAEIYIPAASETEAVAAQYKLDKAVPKIETAQTVEFRNVVGAERSVYKPFSPSGRRRSSPRDQPSDSRWVADIKVPNAVDGEPRLIVFKKVVEVSDQQLKSKLGESNELRAASSLAFKPMLESTPESAEEKGSSDADEGSDAEEDADADEDPDMDEKSDAGEDSGEGDTP